MLTYLLTYLQAKKVVSLTLFTGFIGHLAYTAVLPAEHHSLWGFLSFLTTIIASQYQSDN